MKTAISLPVFPPAPSHGLISCLGYPRVETIVHYVLGPAGTNMEQACRAWTSQHGLGNKTKIVLCETPEESLTLAREMNEPRKVPTFWTCAVYFALNKLFFNNPDVYPFLFSFDFPLDNMQLAAKAALELTKVPRESLVATHPSPAPLVKSLVENQGLKIMTANSNAHAAKMCADGKVELCVTTAKAAAENQLVTIHSFGSPIMVFFAGTTQHGVKVLLGS